MKKSILSLLGCLLVLGSFAQVKYQDGPALNNEENERMNRMIEGDNGSFYAYRIRTRGKGTSYIIEKVDQATMKIGFSIEVPIPTERTKVIDVQYASGQVYVFYHSYDKEAETMRLNYRMVSSEGKLSPSEVVLISKKTDHYEFIDFNITSNHNKSKLAVKTCFKSNKLDQYKTDFVLLNASNQKIEWTKTVNKFLKRSDQWYNMSFFGKGTSEITTGFLGFILNDNDDIYYAYNEKLKTTNKKEDRYDANVELLLASSSSPINVPLKFNPEFLLYDIMFSINKQNNLVIAGFYKDIIERTGRDLVDVGVFNYRIDITNGAIVGKAIKTFDDKMLTALDSNRKRARGMMYKTDYVIPNGDDFYLVGEQYRLDIQTSGGGMYGGGNVRYIYRYMDIIVAKITSAGEFEWVGNAPLRNEVILGGLHVYKQYFALNTSKGLYFFYNEHPDNVDILASKDFEPDDLKYQRTIHGSNFAYSKISPQGIVSHAIAFKNKDYCFAPIQETNLDFTPPQEAEIFVNGKQNEVFIYTEDRGKGRFCKVKIE